jgi:SDR family mycofactocin-dependent oxidoreductase
MGRLENQVAIVTGAGRAQGRSHALALAAEGATVVAVDIAAPIDVARYPMSSQADLEETVHLVEKAGGTAIPVVTDVRDSGAVNAMTQQAIDRFGRVDILVANAGLCYWSTVEDMTDEQWSTLMETNLYGVFYCVRAVLPQMRRQQHGRIVATSSVVGRGAMPNVGHYVASKWAVNGLIKTVAMENGPYGITANTVAPSTVHSPMTVNESNYKLFCPELEHPTEKDMFPRLTAMNFLNKPWIEPETVSKAVLYLVCDEGFTTGTVLEINLGVTADGV